MPKVLKTLCPLLRENCFFFPVYFNRKSSLGERLVLPNYRRNTNTPQETRLACKSAFLYLEHI